MVTTKNRKQKRGMKFMIKATLVLEGGANRGVFTSGVLDYLMGKELYMSNVIGVSAGACNAVDYVSKQAGRSRECVIHREKEYDYVYGLKKTLKEKALMDMDMLFDKFPNEIYPFDFETYFASEMECELVVTNCITGAAEYLSEDKDPERLMKICRASSSMPLAAPIANVDGISYMDGGLADSIPIEYALEKGNDKIVVVLTRNPGYRKKRALKATEQLYKRAYKKYPNLVRAIMTRNAVYNRQMKLIAGFNVGNLFEHRHQFREVEKLRKSSARTIARTLRGKFNGGGGFTKSRCPAVEVCQPFLLECAILQIAHDRVQLRHGVAHGRSRSKHHAAP